MNLVLRGINVNFIIRPLYLTDTESTYHALMRWPKAFMVWESVASWCGVSGLFLWEVSDLSSVDTLSLVQLASKDIWESILVVTSWCIWRTRNEVVHATKA